MTPMQGVCLMALVFITALQLNKKTVQPKLLRMVCFLYCNQQLRRLFALDNDTAINLFNNILLATALAVFLTALSDKEDLEAADDLRNLLEGLLYMYGDILDFAFGYGVMAVTVTAFGVGVVLQSLSKPTDPMQDFFRRLVGIVNTNLLYQGITSMISSTPNMKLVESIAATSVLRVMLPPMESYLTYLTAAQMTMIVPGIAPILLCAILWVDFLPSKSRGWVSELLATYVISATVIYLIKVPIWGAMVVLILIHNIDYIIGQLQADSKK